MFISSKEVSRAQILFILNKCKLYFLCVSVECCHLNSYERPYRTCSNCINITKKHTCYWRTLFLHYPNSLMLLPQQKTKYNTHKKLKWNSTPFGKRLTAHRFSLIGKRFASFPSKYIFSLSNKTQAPQTPLTVKMFHILNTFHISSVGCFFSLPFYSCSKFRLPSDGFV